MIHAKQDRYGLDAKIYQMQLALQEDLSWQDCAGDEAIAIYGKIQKTVIPSYSIHYTKLYDEEMSKRISAGTLKM